MPNLQSMDATILSALSSAGLTDTATVGGRQIEGYYSRVFIEEGAGEEAVAGFAQLFDCRAEDLGEVLEGDSIDVTGQGTFRVLRAEPDGTGRVVIRLGSFL